MIFIAYIDDLKSFYNFPASETKILFVNKK